MTDQDKLFPEMPRYSKEMDAHGNFAIFDNEIMNKPYAVMHYLHEKDADRLLRHLNRTTPPDAAARIARLEEALRWYGDEENYCQTEQNLPCSAASDKGQRAREALK